MFKELTTSYLDYFKAVYIILYLTTSLLAIFIFFKYPRFINYASYGHDLLKVILLSLILSFSSLDWLLASV
jgi:hypothetical protein